MTRHIIALRDWPADLARCPVCIDTVDLVGRSGAPLSGQLAVSLILESRGARVPAFTARRLGLYGRWYHAAGFQRPELCQFSKVLSDRGEQELVAGA